MPGYADNVNYSGTPLGYSPMSASTARGGWGPGGGPAPAPQINFQAPMNYAGLIGNYNTQNDFSMGSNFSGSGSNSNNLGFGGIGQTQMDPSGMTGITSQPVDPTKLKDDTSGGLFGKGALDKFKTLTDIIGTFGNIYAGIQMNKIAKQQLAFSKESYAENLKNQKKTYNNSSEARSRSAGVQNNWSDAEVNAHIAKRAL